MQLYGPYAIAGYYFGAMLAFEASKILEAEKDEVRFLRSYNLPPHIKARMRQLDWIQALLNLANFLDLITESYLVQRRSGTRWKPKETSSDRHTMLETTVQAASRTRLSQLSFDREILANWASLAHAMQQAALEYEPSGSGTCIDVSIAILLIGIAKSKEEWYRNHLSPWKDFSRTAPRFLEVDGAHYTMMNKDHINTFQRILRSALRERGLCGVEGWMDE